MRTKPTLSLGMSIVWSSFCPICMLIPGRCHMFYGQRVMDIPDGLPKWSGLNDSSDLIEDSPPELVREHERKREEERKERFEKGENK